MRLSEKMFGSQNVINQQESVTFNTYGKNIKKTMSQSSSLSFEKIYNAFDSTGQAKKFPLDQFKNSQAKSIIQKLMQTKKNKDDEFQILNEPQNMQQRIEQKQAITLEETQQKIFSEVVNLLTEISEIKEKTQKQKSEFKSLKIELHNLGIQYPQVQERKQSEATMTKRFTSEELEQILQQNEELQLQIGNFTKQILNSREQIKEKAAIQPLLEQNKKLKQQLSQIKEKIIDHGEIDNEDISLINQKIIELQQQISALEDKGYGKVLGKDEELKLLKVQNEQLRYHTISFLKNNSKKIALIQFMRHEQQQKQRYVNEIKLLKMKHQLLAEQNQKLKKELDFQPSNPYSSPYQIQSQVSKFQQNQTERTPSYDKQNYYQNYEPERIRQNHQDQNQKYYSRYNTAQDIPKFSSSISNDTHRTSYYSKYQSKRY